MLWELSPWYLPTFDRWFGLAFVRMLICCCVAILALIVLIDNLENFDEFVEYAKKYDKTTWQMVGILAGHYAAYAPSSTRSSAKTRSTPNGSGTRTTAMPTGAADLC